MTVLNIFALLASGVTTIEALRPHVRSSSGNPESAGIGPGASE